MRSEIRDLLHNNGGVATRAELTAVVPHHVVDRAVSGGHLVRALPRVYTESHLLEQPMTKLRSALRYAGDNAALSHTTGLALWELPLPPVQPLHVTTDSGQFTADPAVIVHRRRGFRAEPPLVVCRQGLKVMRLERCLADSWPLLNGDEQRAPLIVAVQRRLTTPPRMLELILAERRLRGRRSLLELVELLAAGCHSELEIWGLRHVFDHPSLPLAQRQLSVRLGAARLAYLDVPFVKEMVDVELDGSSYHFSTKQRERDMRRDAALATLGWLVLRFSHQRLHEQPDAVRAEVATVLAVRRHQLRIA